MQPQQSNLAIVIPFYNISFFRETLDSLAKQTDKRFNVYIGDDAATENLQNLLEDFKEKIYFQYHRFEKNLGGTSLVKQWERCIDLMQNEEWLMVLGDDDYLSENVVEEFYKNLDSINQENINVIKLNSAIVDETNTIKSEKKKEPQIKSSIEHFFDKYVNEGRSSLSEHIFRKSQYDKIGFLEMPFAWHSDDLAVLEISEYGNVFFIENAKCFVRVSSQSISGNSDKNKKEKWAATKIFFDRVGENLDKFNPTEKRKLFDLIEWHEQVKNIKVKIPNKFSEFCKVYGWRGMLKFLRACLKFIKINFPNP